MKNVQKVFYKVKPPCSKCPYKLGQVHTMLNPCPQCKLSGYQSYEQFLKQVSKIFQE